MPKIIIFIIIIIIFPSIRISQKINQQSIDYSRLNTPSFHRPLDNTNLDKNKIGKFSSVSFVEVWKKSNQKGYTSKEFNEISYNELNTKKASASIIIFQREPSYTYNIIENEIVTSGTKCTNVQQGKFILGDSWNNEVLYGDKFPTKIREYGDHATEISIEKVNPDNSIEFVWDKKKVKLLPGEEYIKEIKEIGFFYIRTYYYGITNFGIVKNKCF